MFGVVEAAEGRPRLGGRNRGLGYARVGLQEAVQGRPVVHERLMEPRARRVRPRGVRISLIGLPLAAVRLAGFTAACSGQQPTYGTLTSHLYGVGGPAPEAPRPWPGTMTLTGPGVHRDIRIGASGS